MHITFCHCHLCFARRCLLTRGGGIFLQWTCDCPPDILCVQQFHPAQTSRCLHYRQLLIYLEPQCIMAPACYEDMLSCIVCRLHDCVTGTKVQLFLYVNNKCFIYIQNSLHITVSVKKKKYVIRYFIIFVSLSLLGSSTACIVVLDRRSHRLHTCNLGDSGFLVVRGGEVVHRSDEQQHYFNTPFQLSIAPPGAEGVVLSDRWVSDAR